MEHYNYKDKNLMIIGAGLLQVPAIKTANRIGCTTIVTDYNDNAPGMQLADHPHVMSTRDIEGTVRLAKSINKKLPIHGVITVGTDASMTVAAVANALGLAGIAFENAVAATNKIKMRERLSEHNVPIPGFRRVWSFQDLVDAVSELSYPLVIKPADNMGARGVFKIERESFLRKAFDQAKTASPSGELIVEEYMEGPELSIDALIYNDEIHITGIADRIIDREPYFIELGHVMPSALPQEQLEDAVETFKRGIRALGLSIGAAKGDIKVTPKGAKIGEIAARLSGGFMSAYTYPYASGVDLIHNAIDVALGFPPHNLVPTRNWVSIEKAIIPPPGVITEISGIEKTGTLPGVKNIFLHKEIGDEVREPESNVEKSGNIIVAMETREEAWEAVKRAETTIRIVTEKKSYTWDEIRHRAREKFNGTCRACRICNGEQCRGQFPGVGGTGTGNAFIRNIQDLERVLIRTRVIHDIEKVDTGCDFFGRKLELPVLIAPITGCDINLGGRMSEIDYARIIMRGAKNSGIFAFAGDGAQPDLYRIGLEAIGDTKSPGGIIFKARKDEESLFMRVDDAASTGVGCFGIDVDSAAFLTLALMGQATGVKSIEALRRLRERSDIPFILKGILSVKDARAAIEAGADAIVVGNHGGRITEHHPSGIAVLGEIRSAVGEKIRIIVDGGLRSGEDIFKAIAAGADYVMIGRPFMVAAFGGGVEAIELYTEKLGKELERCMMLTGCRTIADINREHVIIPSVWY